jgi:hypothetical protein
MSTTLTHSTETRSNWSRFVTWLFSPPVGADLWAPISPSVRGYPVNPVFARSPLTRRTIR